MRTLLSEPQLTLSTHALSGLNYLLVIYRITQFNNLKPYLPQLIRFQSQFVQMFPLSNLHVLRDLHERRWVSDRTTQQQPHYKTSNLHPALSTSICISTPITFSKSILLYRNIDEASRHIQKWPPTPTMTISCQSRPRGTRWERSEQLMNTTRWVCKFLIRAIHSYLFWAWYHSYPFLFACILSYGYFNTPSGRCW